MKLARFLAWRMASGVFVLWATATLMFAAINLTPGDPAMTVLGSPDALPTPAVLRQINTQYGFNLPLHVQYLHYLARLLHGNLGTSFSLRQPVAALVGQQIGASVALLALAMPIAFGLAVGIAAFTVRRARWLTSALDTVEMIFATVPIFVQGLVLLLLFSFSLHLFPSSGTQGLTSLVLPAITIVLPLAAVLAQLLRREMEDILLQPFIVTVRARGLSEIAVRFGHALRHAMIPLLTLAGFLFSALISNTVVVETEFNRQGMGRLLADATTNRDVPLVLGVVLVATAVNVGITMLVDILVAVVDPRVARQ